MAGGIAEFNKITQVSANPGKKVRLVNLSFTTAIGVGAVTNIDVYAPTGYVTTLKALNLKYPTVAGSASGYTACDISVGGNSAGLTYGYQNYNADLEFNYGHWKQAVAANVFPPDKIAQQSAIPNAVYDEVNFLRFAFNNGTNVADGGSTKKLVLWVTDEKISG